MKIAVITFSDFNTNYGSMLQALAMSQYLERLGHNVEFIKYREFNEPEYRNNLEKFVKTIKRICVSAYRVFKWNDIKKTESSFERFRNRYFKYTTLCVTSEDFEKLPLYDCYICGSDQIWNINCLGGLRKPYFLSFAPEDKCKIAYAASMGDYVISDEYREEIVRLVERLNFVSVREKESVEQLKKETQKEITHVVDPVFLLDKEKWDELSGKRIVNGDYAVCYLVRRSSLCRVIIRKLSKKYSIPIINLSDNQIYVNGTVSKYITSDPLEFVSLIKFAKFAVGTSFHLAAFSTIFGVPFLIAGLESNRNRLNNLLSIVKMEDNYVTNENEVGKAIETFINIKPDTYLMNKLISESKLFFDNALNSNKEK